MTYIQYLPQSCRKEKNNAYQPHSNNIYQLYNTDISPPVPLYLGLVPGEGQVREEVDVRLNKEQINKNQHNKWQ